MMGTQIRVCVTLLFILGSPIISCDCVSISPKLHVVSVGKNVSSIPTFAAITCAITDALLEDVDIRWQLPNGTYLSNTTGRFHVENNTNMEILLVIERAFYQDNGTYSCEAKNSSDNDWSSASVELVLLVYLEAGEPVSVFDNVTSAELKCDMAGFIPEDSALKWYRNDELVVEDERVTVNYILGKRSAARGDTMNVKSTVSVLTFTDPNENDTGEYECRIEGYDLPTQTVQLTVKQLDDVSATSKPFFIDSVVEGKKSNITFTQPLLPLLPDNIGSGLHPTDIHIQPLSSSDLITTDVITVTITTSFYTSLFISSYTPSLSPSSTSMSEGNNVDLLFIFVILTIGLGLLIAIALALLFCVCFCQRRTSNITVVAKNRKNDSKVEEMTLRSPIGKFEVVRPNIETNAIDFPQISTSDTTHPQELLAYDIPTSFLPLPPPPTQITPSNSIRVSVFQQNTNRDEDHNILNVVSSDRQDEAISDYVEPIDTLNPYADHQSSNPSSNDTDNENVTADPPPPPPRNHYKMDKSCSSGSDFPDYDHVYTEALEPSMLGGKKSPFQNRNEGLPYGHIYDMSRKSKRIHHLFCISPQNIRAIQELGRGHFGKVYLAATTGVSLKDLKLSDDDDKTRSLLVAVKQLKPTANTNLRDAFQKEVKFMSRLHHANVARVLAICSTSTPFIMMEYMENGDLNEFLRKQELKPDTVSTLNENEVTPMILLYIAVQIASGMKYLATKKFVHRDLATRNCLVGRDFVTKISDFGMSRNIYELAYYLVGGQLILPIRWMATETYYGKFSVKSDAWSFGVTVWELFTLCRDMPYADLTDDEVIADALRGESREILTKPEACPHEVYSVMQRCFVHQANIRADFEELYSRLFVVYSALGQQAAELPQN